MTELTAYLSNIMGSVLLGLPDEMKEVIYLDALIHAASHILVSSVSFFPQTSLTLLLQALPLDPAVTTISPTALHTLDLDVQHLTSYISSISLASPTATTAPTARPFSMAFAASTTTSSAPTSSAANTARAAKLQSTLLELKQTLALMLSSDPLEFYDSSQRNNKYGSVNPQNGAELLEKVERGREGAGPPQVQQSAMASVMAAVGVASTGRSSNEYGGERSGTPTGGGGNGTGDWEDRLKAGGAKLFGSMRGLSKRTDGSGGSTG